VANYKVVRDQILVVSSSGDDKTARDQLMNNKEVAGRVVDAFAKHLQFNVDLAHATANDGAKAKSQALMIALLIAAATFGLVGANVFLVSRYVVTALNSSVQAANKVAKGDITVVFPATHQDEIGVLGNSLNDAFRTLQTSMQEVRHASMTVASGATELSTSAEEMLATTAEIAKSGETLHMTTDSVAAAITQFMAHVESTAANVHASVEHMEHAVKATEEGSSGSKNATSRMAVVQDVTAKISSAVVVIQEIAQQTNLLSLNAAIEAAKAGHQGKGFAVVAEEVRKLAERCRQATVDIEKLICDSHTAVADGVTAVENTTVLMDLIHQSIGNVSGRLHEIGAATREQATAAADIAQRMAESAKEVGQNAAATHQLSATVHEISRTASELAQVSDTMAASVAKFQLG
jgi:methyl-accepting chemotaxis protein